MKRLFGTLSVRSAQPQREAGFIPLLVCVFLVVVIVTYLVYLRVAHAHQ